MSTSLALNKVRNQTQKTIRRYKLQELRTKLEQINEYKEIISQLKAKQKQINRKRQRLISQNFSSADHLKKTHTKYWNNLSEISLEIREYQMNLRYTLQEFIELKESMIN